MESRRWWAPVMTALIILTSGCAKTAAPSPTAAPEETARVEVADRGLRDSLKFDSKRSAELADADGRNVFLAFDFSAKDAKGIEVRRFEKPVTVVLRYGAINLGLVREGDLTIVYLDPDKNRWTDVPSKVNSAQKEVSADVDHFSKYGVAAQSGSASAATPVARAAGGAAAATVVVAGTAVGGVAAVGGAVQKYDVTAALNTFSMAVYGVTYTYTETGGAAAGVIASATFPEGDKSALNTKLAAAGVAAYGKIATGLEVVLTAIAVASSGDAGVDIAAGGLGEVSVSGQPFPATEADALALIKTVAPKLAGLPWTVKSTAGGGYVYFASGTITISGAKGSVSAPAGALATVTRSSEGKAVVSVLVGTGTQATVVK